MFYIENLTIQSSFYWAPFIGNIYVYKSNLTLISSSFKHFMSNDIGSCLFAKDSNISIDHSDFTDYYPNCIYGEKSLFKVNSTSFQNNYAQLNASFMCLYCLEIFIENSIFNSNFGPLKGVALFLFFAQHITIFHTNFINNTAFEGGAIHIRNSNVSISFCFFEKNNADYGGAIFLQNSQEKNFIVSIFSSNFSSNKAIMEGGAIKYTDNIPDLIFIVYENNMAFYGPDIASYPIRIGFKVYKTKVLLGFLSFIFNIFNFVK